MSETIYCWFVCIPNASIGMQMKLQNRVIKLKKKDCPHNYGKNYLWLLISRFLGLKKNTLAYFFNE